MEADYASLYRKPNCFYQSVGSPAHTGCWVENPGMRTLKMLNYNSHNSWSSATLAGTGGIQQLLGGHKFLIPFLDISWTSHGCLRVWEEKQKAPINREMSCHDHSFLFQLRTQRLWENCISQFLSAWDSGVVVFQLPESAEDKDVYLHQDLALSPSPPTQVE